MKRLIILFLPIIALAHTTKDISGGFLSGFLHPISGFDHVVAMIAVGLWGSQLKEPAIWILPITFPIVMAFGAMVGVIGVNIPFVEIAIALSAVILGFVVAFKIVPKLWIAGVIVAFFAIFHGYAHGIELPTFANPIAFASGFVIATGFLHLIGIIFGLIDRYKNGEMVIRIGGGVIFSVGVYFLYLS